MVSGDAQSILSEMHALLLKFKPWLRFFAVLVFIGCAFAFLIGLVFSLLPGGMGVDTLPGGRFFGIIYMAFAVIMVFPGLYLTRAAGSLGRLRQTGEPGDALAAVRHQLSFWRFYGYFTIVVFVLYLLFVVGVVVFSVLSA